MLHDCYYFNSKREHVSGRQVGSCVVKWMTLNHLRLFIGFSNVKRLLFGCQINGPSSVSAYHARIYLHQVLPETLLPL